MDVPSLPTHMLAAGGVDSAPKGGRVPAQPGPSASVASASAASKDDGASAAHVALFAEVFREQFRYVWTSLHRLGVPERDLEDVTHDVLVAVYPKLRDYDPARPIRPWLFAFAVRFAADYRRLHRNAYERLDVEVEATHDGPNAEDAVLADERRSLVLRALESIDETRRPVFVLHELDGIAMPEIAIALEIPLNTAYSRLRLAREEFVPAVRRLKQRERGGSR